MTDVHGALTAQAELLDALVTPDPPPRRGWPFVLLALVLLTAAAAIGVVVVSRDDGPQGPPHPSKWDASVQKYVDFVEKKRDLKFTHPVYVDFLADAEFTENVTADDDDLTDEDRKEIEQSTGLLRALGLVEGDLDLFDKSNQLRGKGVIGYYSYDDERLRIRGTEITPAVESTIVHELTHALQDQNFDLGKRYEELAEADDANSSAASDGFDALVEGDARRIEGKWRDSLSARDRRALDKDQGKGAKDFEAGSKDIPEVLKTMIAAPYELGQAMLAVAVQQGGDRAVDDLFRSPPKTEEQQLDPWTLVADHQGFLNVPEPELADGEKALADDNRRRVRRPRLAAGPLGAGAPRTGADRGRRLGWRRGCGVRARRDQLPEGQLPRRHPRGPGPDADRAAGLGEQGPEGGRQRLQGRRDPGLHVLRPGQEGGEGGDRQVDGCADARADPHLPVDHAGQGHGARPGRALRC